EPLYMAKSLFIAPTSMDSGLTSVCLGLLRAMERVGISVGFYKPFCPSVNQGKSVHNDGEDSSVTFARSRSHLQPPDPIPLNEGSALTEPRQIRPADGIRSGRVPESRERCRCCDHRRPCS